MKDNPPGTPSPYQEPLASIEVIQVFYYSPTKGAGVFLGKTIKRTSDKGEVSYRLLDSEDNILGPDLSTEKLAREIWATIAEVHERRFKELRDQRKGKDNEQNKGKER